MCIVLSVPPKLTSVTHIHPSEVAWGTCWTPGSRGKLRVPQQDRNWHQRSAQVRSLAMRAVSRRKPHKACPCIHPAVPSNLDVIKQLRTQTPQLTVPWGITSCLDEGQGLRRRRSQNGVVLGMSWGLSK